MNASLWPVPGKGWKMFFDGHNVSLTPSIGLSYLPCRSHYFIIKNKIVWCDD